MIVVDASVVVSLILHLESWEALAARIGARDTTLHAPHLLDVEFHQALRRFALAREIDDTRAEQAREDFEDLHVTRYPHLDLLHRAWQLRTNLTIYDGVYVALAEALNAPLWTIDSKLARAVPKFSQARLLA